MGHVYLKMYHFVVGSTSTINHDDISFHRSLRDLSGDYQEIQRVLRLLAFSSHLLLQFGERLKLSVFFPQGLLSVPLELGLGLFLLPF